MRNAAELTRPSLAGQLTSRPRTPGSPPSTRARAHTAEQETTGMDEVGKRYAIDGILGSAYARWPPGGDDG
jgi:hypothetical protein